MYTIKAFVDGKEYMIHNPRVKALIVGDPYYQKGDNVNGQAEFSVSQYKEEKPQEKVAEYLLVREKAHY